MAVEKSAKLLFATCFILFQGVVCLGLGIAIFNSPGWFASLTSIEASELHGVTDIRATYGGLFTVVGLSALAAAMVHRWRVLVLGTLMLVYAGLGIARVTAAIMSADFSTYTWICAGFEMISFAIATLLYLGGTNDAR